MGFSDSFPSVLLKMNTKYFNIFAVLFLSFGHVWITTASADELTYQESQTIDIKLLPGESVSYTHLRAHET